MTRRTRSTDTSATEKLGERVGQRLKGGEIIDIVSEVGGGKTALVRGLARGMGSQDKVSSPSFTISKLYKAGSLTLQHFDFYRLDDPGLVAHELFEVIGDPHTIVAIEWSEVVKQVLPEKRLTVAITYVDATTRDIEFRYPTSLQYLMETL